MLWGTWGVRVLARMSIPPLASGVLILSITVSMSVEARRQGFLGAGIWRLVLWWIRACRCIVSSMQGSE